MIRESKSLVIIGICCLISIGFLFQSCEKEEIDLNNNEVDYELIGIEHNKGLEYIFEQLKSKNKSLKSTSINGDNEYFKLTNSLTKEFINEKSVFSSKSELYNAEYNDLSNEGIQLKSSSIDKRNVLSNALESEDAKELLQLLLKTIETCNHKNFNRRISKLEKINSEIDRLYNSKDVMMLKSVCSVGKHSLSYWSENYSKWKNELSTSSVKVPQYIRLKSANSEGDDDAWYDFNWGAIGASDAVSAGIGVTHLAISGTGGALVATGPGGWVAIGAVVTGYAIEGSAASMLVDIFY